MRTWLSIPVLCAAVVLSACSITGTGSNSANGQAQNQELTPEESVVEGPCGGLVLNDAVETYLDQVPPAPADMQWHVFDDSTYDPCLPLSWIQLVSIPGDANSESQVMLFHENRFIGTADTFNTTQVSVVRRDDYTIEVTSQQERGLITDTYIFNPTERALEKHVGFTETETASAPAEADLVETEERFTLQSGESYSFRTPTGNIGCTIEAERTECSVLSLSDSGNRTANALIIEDGEVYTTRINGRPAWVAATNSDEYVLQYGETITFENVICLSEQEGLTCQDSITGAGGTLNRSGVSTY